MAITTVGFDGTVNESQWARYGEHKTDYKHCVSTGFVGTAGGGTRQASITSGIATAPGLLIDSDATVTTTHAANAGSVNRVDYVVLESNWTTNTTTLVVVTGSSPSAPALTQTAGTLWQLPLARVTVRPGVTTLLSSDVVVCKPLPRNEILYSATVPATSVAYNAALTTAATIVVGDPGWPYTMTVVARGRFFAAATGVGLITVGDETGEFGRVYTQLLSLGADDISLVHDRAGPLTGPRSVTYKVGPSGMSSGSSAAIVAGGTTQFSVRVVPA